MARLMRLGRTCPDLPAPLMFDPDEIKAAYVLTNKPTPTLPQGCASCVTQAMRRVVCSGMHSGGARVPCTVLSVLKGVTWPIRMMPPQFGR
jgi:Transposase Tn5 dimerisation domain